MNLEKNYKLLDVVRDDGIRTFEAEEIASGNALQVHLFVNAPDQSLFEQVRALPLSGRRAILEFGDELRIPYLITDPLPAGTDTRAWLTSLVQPVAKTPDTKAPESKTQEHKTQEIKKQPIKASVWKTGTPIPDPLFPDDAPEREDDPGEFARMFQVKTPDSATAPPTEAPGEFTLMFQVPLPAPPDTSAPVKTSPSPAAQQPLSAPAHDPPAYDLPSFDPEATKLFKIPDLPAPLPPAPPPPAEPGEFTRLFQAMQDKPALSPAAEASAPGEFTRFFQSPLAPSENKSNSAEQAPFQPPPPAPPPPNRPSEFTQMFGSASGKTPPAAGPLGKGTPFNGSATGAFARPVPPPPGIQPASSKPSTPGQFAQMMSAAGSAPTLGQQAAPAPPAAAKKSNLPLIIILVALALFAVLLVAFFAMRH